MMRSVRRATGLLVLVLGAVVAVAAEHVSPAAARASAIPTHVQNWLNACADTNQTCHENQNVGISAAWMAAHVDWNEVYYQAANDSTSAELAAAGAKHIVIYVDPNITAYCRVPPGYGVGSFDFPEDGANCSGQVTQYLHAQSGSYAHAYDHQANGNRLFDRADGLYNGKAQEPLYIGDPDLRTAFRTATLQNGYATDVFEDDAGAAYNCIDDDDDFCGAAATYGRAHYAPPECDYSGGYWCYKYGETAIEWDRAANPQQAYANDAIALANASAHDVIGNNGAATDPYDLQWLSAARVEGVMSEGAWPQASGISRWVSEADNILTYHKLGKFVVEEDTDARGLLFQIASHWIVFDPTYSIEFLAEINHATSHVGSADTTYPEEAIVPTQPLIATPSSNDVTVFQVSPGVFVREYAACYQAGVPIGHCAAMINTNASSRSIAGLTQSYSRVVVRNTSATWAAGGAAVWSTSVPGSITKNTGMILAR